jgi:hypothetical protein
LFGIVGCELLDVGDEVFLWEVGRFCAVFWERE